MYVEIYNALVVCRAAFTVTPGSEQIRATMERDELVSEILLQILVSHFLFFLPLSPFPFPQSSIPVSYLSLLPIPLSFTLLFLTISCLLFTFPPLSSYSPPPPGQASEGDWGASVGQCLWPVHRTVEQAGREEGRG